MPISDKDYPTTDIATPGTNDILCGRGGGTNAHPGNIKFRKLVAAHKLRYLAASKSDKPGVARDVVREWRAMDPPGRFLAKSDARSTPQSQSAGDSGDDSNGKLVMWYDVGDKKAREKASQCLRERNGAANEAVAALVKTVTASGEACPEDYATLMNKAAMVKAQNDLTIQQQHDMLQMNQQMGSGHGQHQQMDNQKQQQQHNNMNGNGNGNGNRYINSNGGHESFEPISLQQQQQGYGQGQGRNNNTYHDSNAEDDLIEAEIQRLLEQRQQQLMSGQNQISHNNGNGNGNVHGGSLPNSSSRSPGAGNGHGGQLPNKTKSNDFSGGPQPYMGEESIMREYEQLVHKQRELNMMAGKMNGMPNGLGGMNNNGGMNNGGMNSNGMNGMMNGMNNNGMRGMMNGMNNNMGGMMNNNNMGMGGMMPQATGSNNMGMNNNGIMDGMGGNNFAGMQSNHNPDAAKDYMNRLRMLRQGGGGGGGGRGNNNNNNNNQGGGMGSNIPDQTTSASSLGYTNNGYSGNGNNNNGGIGVGGGSNNNMMNNMGNMQRQQVQGKSRSGPEEFTIEEYQASLQQFLSHNDDYGGSSNNSSLRPDLMTSREESQHNQHANNLTSNSGGYSNNNNAMSSTIQCIQVPTNLEDGTGKRAYRSSLKSVDDSDLPIGRNTFKSVDSTDRPSFQSMDDMDIRGTFRSVDTMDLMSIGNSINEIMEDDIKNNPEAARKKYGRRLSANSRYSKSGNNNNAAAIASLNDFAHMPGQTLEIKTMDHGRGSASRGGPKKKKGNSSMIDPRLASGQTTSGTRQSVQTKGCDGPSGGMARGSQLSIKNLDFDGVDDASRMSFGNMSIMSELTDFQEMAAKGGHMDSFKDL